MRIGITHFVTDRGIPIVELARAVEARGLDSLYIPEHTHIPVSRRSPYPGGGELPDEYRRTLDPFVALSAAAAVTSRIRVGTGICLVAQRDPIVTAKEVATLDHLSGGRFTFGIGVGWNEDEAADHGIDFRRRRAVVRERVLAMQRLWSDEIASFEGEFVHLPPSWAWPKPVQSPRPPILFGGAASPRLFEHIAEYADGWMPIGGAGVTAVLPDLHRAFERAGRDPATAQVVLYSVVPTAAKLEHYLKLGVPEVVLAVPQGTADEVLALLDRYAEILRDFAR